MKSKAHKPAEDHPWRKARQEHLMRSKIKASYWRSGSTRKLRNLLVDQVGSPEEAALTPAWEKFASLDKY